MTVTWLTTSRDKPDALVALIKSVQVSKPPVLEGTNATHKAKKHLIKRPARKDGRPYRPQYLRR